jgi:hypothetical protein
MSKELTVRAEQLPALVEEIGQAIARVETPLQADQLWRKIKSVEKAGQIVGAYEEDLVKLRRLQLRAKRRLGELLGEGKPGAPVGSRNAAKNNVSGSSVISKSERFTRTQARKLAQAPDDVFEDVLSADSIEKISEAAILKSVRAQARKGDLDKQRSTYSKPEGLDLRTGDFRKVLADIEDESVSLILTDPPYAEAATHLYGELAEWASQKLKPGGSCIAYCGQSTMPAVLSVMDEWLRYWWVLAVEHTVAQRLPGKFVFAEWKPALWFVKDSRQHQRLLNDRLRAKGTAHQEEHPWAQDGGLLIPVYEQLTDPGDLVVDPFAGTGSFGVVAAGMNRNWIGADLGAATF